MAAEHILIVDDEALVHRLLQRELEAAGYVTEVAEDAATGRALLAERPFGLVLSDVTMPGESGIALAEWIRARYPETAVVMCTGVDDPDIAERALELGVYGYLVKPVTGNALRIHVANALRRRALELESARHRDQLADQVELRTLELGRAVEDLRRSREETIHRLARAVEFRDVETGDHIRRMGRWCRSLAEGLGLAAARCELIGMASPLHDIGKIGVPDSVLLNPAPLSPQEWTTMRSHAELGYRLLAGSGQDLLDEAAMIAWTHHERVDGSGYPRGLRGDEIPVEGRIAAVADVFDAITSDRVYQRAQSREAALAVIEDGKGSLFDAEVVELFAEIVHDPAYGDGTRPEA